jgi:Protein of unknown function with PCYCGC motif
MKNKNLIIVIAVLAVVACAVVFLRGDSPQQTSQSASPDVSHSHAQPATDMQKAPIVPAFQTVADSKSLGPTLPPSQFFGKAREAYQVAKEIPQILAQLPCYCHCDRGLGHKSLHTCFEDDHASHCAVCVDEALLAYQLQKNEHLTPEQIRERIIQKYTSSE